MENPSTDNDRTRELYVELGALLRHKRSPEIESTVNEIIKSDISVEEKLRKIKELDERPFKSQLHFVRRAGKDNAGDTAPAMEPSHEELSARGIYTSVYAKERRKRLKQSPRKSGFFEFLFRDYPRLTEFQERTGVIECSFIPPTVRSGRRVEKLFVDSVFIPARDLIHPLAVIEANGWTALTKTEYNLLIEFKRLIERIISLSAEANRNGESGFFPKLRRLELHFLICHGRAEWPDMIINGMEASLKAAKYDANISVVCEAARKVLMPRLTGASLYAMILALTVVDKRRMVSLEDIVDRAGTGIISNYNFECPPSVETAIAARVQSLVTELTVLAAQRRAIMAVKAFVRRSADGFDFTILRDIIAASGRVEPLPVYEGNMIVFAAAFARAFTAQFESLFTGVIPLADGSVRVFSEECFRHIFTDLMHHADKLERLARVDQHVVISRERIAGMISVSVGSSITRTTGEIEVLQAVTRLSSIMTSLGEDIAAAARGMRSGIDAKPIELIDIKRGACMIPRADDRVKSGITGGETVTGALIIAATACHTAAVFMHDQKICALLEREERTNEDIRRRKSELERLAAAPVYESFKDIDA